MSRDEIREIAEIVGGDKTYKHFVHRINKEFDISDEKRNSDVYVLFEKKDDAKIGFCVIGHSPVKMKVWEKVFKEEGWVDEDFSIGDAYELMYMYIKPKYRERGAGKKLFEKASLFTRDNGIKHIYSYVSDKNPNALQFYHRMNAQTIQDFSDEEVSAAFLKWDL